MLSTRAPFLAIAMLTAALTDTVRAEDFQREVVIAHDSDAPGPYRHPSMFDELDNGDLFVVYYGGEGEYKGDTAVYGFRKPHGSNRWTRPQIIADTPGRSRKVTRSSGRVLIRLFGSST